MNFVTDPDASCGNQSTIDTSRARIGHVNLRVADLDRATAFYSNVLGMTVSCYGPDIGVPTVFLSFGGYHHHLALTWFYSHVSTSRDAGQSGLNHFAIVYPDELSLARAVSEVLEHGELIDDARDHGATISVYLHDPDGNRIELYCDRPRCRWFDAWGQLIVDSEPFDLKQWLSDAIIRAAETFQVLVAHMPYVRAKLHRVAPFNPAQIVGKLHRLRFRCPVFVPTDRRVVSRIIAEIKNGKRPGIRMVAEVQARQPKR